MWFNCCNHKPRGPHNKAHTVINTIIYLGAVTWIEPHPSEIIIGATSQFFTQGFSLIGRLAKFWMKRPGYGAKGPLYLAPAPELNNVSGAYYDRLRRQKYALAALDGKISDGLWQLSTQLTGLNGIKDGFEPGR